MRSHVTAKRSTNVPGRPNRSSFLCRSALFRAVYAVRSIATARQPYHRDTIGLVRSRENRAAVRVGGLYGLVDEEGREVVKPQYHIVDDYKFGFAQVDVNGKSGLIDRDGNMVIAPNYGFIEAIGSDRFRVSEFRRIRRSDRI